MHEYDPKIDPTLVGHSSYESSGPSKTPVPYQIGPYRIKGLLKKGGTSLLYLGVLPKTEQLIAVKVLLPKYLSHPEMMSHFLNEAHIIEMANHPNIIKLHGHGKWEGGVYIAMEFVQGITLRKLILQKALPFKRALEIVLEVASALSHLHAHRVVHRDLKPENILLAESGGVKVVDFGISRLVEESKGLTKKRQVMGTLSYMSPEQKINPQMASYPSDQYALAIITYELCVSKLCFGVLQLSQLPKGLRSILLKALKENPTDRYSTIEEFREALHQYIYHDFEDHEDLLDLSFKELSELNQVNYFSLSSFKQLKEDGLGLDYFKPKGIHASHLLSHYYTLPGDWRALVFACPKQKGAPGIFSGAYLKGILSALVHSVEKNIHELKNGPDFLLKQFLHLLNESEQTPERLIFLLFSTQSSELYSYFSSECRLWVKKGASALKPLNSSKGHSFFKSRWEKQEALYAVMPLGNTQSVSHQLEQDLNAFAFESEYKNLNELIEQNYEEKLKRKPFGCTLMELIKNK